MAEARDADRSLRLARQVFSPSEQQRERVLSALAARAAAPPGTPSAGVVGSARDAASAPSKAPARVVALVKPALLIGLGFVIGYWFAEARHAGEAPADGPVAAASLGDPATPERPEALAVAQTEPASSAGAASETEPAQSAPDSASITHSQAESPPDHPAPRPRARGTRDPRRASPGSRAAAADGFAEELALLQRAERALRSGNALLARSFIAELEARFPKTALRQERAALLVLAACATHEPGAERGASEFIARHARSVYVDRIRSLCSLGAPAAPAEPSAGEGTLPRGH
jgi:hypothetical protein